MSGTCRSLRRFERARGPATLPCQDKHQHPPGVILICARNRGSLQKPLPGRGGDHTELHRIPIKLARLQPLQHAAASAFRSHALRAFRLLQDAH